MVAVRGRGDVIGEMALLDQPRTATVRARSAAELVALQKTCVLESLPATRALLGAAVHRLRETEGIVRQNERMAQLGTLTAGVAHELNNPAAAVKRGSEQLDDALRTLEEAAAALDPALREEHRATLDAWAERARRAASSPPEMDALLRSDRESALEGWLDDHGVDDAWELAPQLVNLNLADDELDQVTATFDGETLRSVLAWLAASYAVFNLVAEVSQGATRISELVKALKGYSFLDQAPVNDVDVHEGIDNTLLILRNKLRGISVRRNYAPDLPRIQAYGSELNQVWTNLLDNAADALKEQGEITITTAADGANVMVDVEDNGPGVPADIQPRVFDAFFTTKGPGRGTGMGLNITYKIVVERHGGDIKLESKPGRTQFRVWLPGRLPS
jgi:signal transduction histidine kinase